MTDSSDGIANKQVSRRNVLKWTGALAAAGIVGVGLGLGADLLIRPSTSNTTTATTTKTTTATTTMGGQTTTTTVTAPPTTLSYLPPLSSEVQARVDSIVQSLIASRANDTVVYAGRYQFWSGSDLAGMMRVHVNNGVVTGIEMDDTVNAGVPREDLNWSNVSQGLIQARGSGGGAARTFSYRRYMYRPQRLLYPMKRTGPRGDPNNANWVRITWSEALSTIATQMQQAIANHGPYSIAAWYTGSIPEAAYLNAGCTGWGIASDESTNFATQYVYGASNTAGSEVTDIFNTKLIVLWGAQPSQTPLGAEVGYFVKLAKEKGIPVIAIDYRYSKDVSVIADQWIPIRPGTDSAMMIAIANVLFKNNLYNTDYVSKFVEPTGFQKWKDYVLGNSDGVDKTPQWQESITGVPAQTVIDFANLYAKSNPTYLITTWATGREVHGENYTRAAIYLQSMMGYVGVAGGNSANNQGGNMRATSRPTTLGNSLFGGQPATYKTSVLFKNYKWADAILLRPQYDSGALTQQQYYAAIGNPMTNPAPNVKFIWFNTNLLNQTNNINKEIQAVKAADFVVSAIWNMDQPTGMVADIILPRAEVFEEDPTFVGWGVSGFQFAPKVVQAQGDVKSIFWIHVQIAKALGVIQQFAPQLANVTDADWDSTILSAMQTSYETWAAANKVTTSWSDFLKSPVYRVPITSPQMVQYSAQIQGGKPFLTASGKIEFYSGYLAQGEAFLLTTKYGGHIDPYATYVNIDQGFFDPNVSKYPLMAMSPHSRYRLHSWGDGDPMMRTDVYRHSVWISVADAQARGIKDGDMVKVFNDAGTITLPAYVTSKIVPGSVNIWQGGWAAIDSSGVDERGASNSLMVDTANPDGQWPFHALVEVQKV